jgi:myo-inositol-1(or 4)-monophosphatase
MVCTSIGLTVKGVPVVGVIYNPFLDQLVSALLYLPFTDALPL